MPNTAKQIAIRKAYGEYWEQFPDTAKHQAICNNGYIIERFLNNESGSLLDCIEMVYVDVYEDDDNYVRVYRPKSLQGIESNNGWIRIESEEDLPKESGDYWVYETNGAIGIRFYMSVPQKWGNHEMEVKNPQVSHWQPIVKPEKPIY